MSSEWTADIDFEKESAADLAQRIYNEAWRRAWKKIEAAQDDLMWNGTNNASDESLKLFGLARTYEGGDFQ